MGEELTHAFLVADHFEIHVDLEIPDVGVPIRALQQHPQVINTAPVALTNIDDNAWILPLLQCNFTILVFGLKLQARLGNEKFLLINIRSNLDNGARRCNINGVGNRRLDTIDAACILVNYNFGLKGGVNSSLALPCSWIPPFWPCLSNRGCKPC